MKKLFLIIFIFIIIFTTSGSYFSKSAENMIFVEGGTFQMGDSYGSGSSDERPVNNIKVENFYIGKYEVTQKEWIEVMGYNPSNFKGDNLPVDQVDWYDCIEYCIAKSKLDGLTPYYGIDKLKGDPESSYRYTVSVNSQANGYRLPTEAEWEFAARGGLKSKKTKYAGSDNIDEVSVYHSNSNSISKPVGSKNPNELGIYDMSGNIWEWCWDNYNGYPGNNDKNDNYGTLYRILRGGSWNSKEKCCTISYRHIAYPHYNIILYGFRLARTL